MDRQNQDFPETLGSVEIRHCAGILSGTLVRTMDGDLPVEYLEVGDRIITRSGARRLRSMSVQVRREIVLIRIAASTIGFGRPGHDLCVAPDQLVLIRDWRAQALFGVPAAAIPAERLTDGEFVTAEVQREARLYSLRFAEDEVIWAEGLEIACPAMEVKRAAL